MKIKDLLSQRMLRAEVADTPIKCEKGLMFRNKLEDDGGMLFVFDSPRKLNFWGRNTYIPLDIAFVSDNNTILKISNISPLNLKSISSDENCIMAIETNYNYFKNNRIKVGDKVKIDNSDQNIALISFEGNI
jgi:uncharacterized protein